MEIYFSAKTRHLIVMALLLNVSNLTNQGAHKLHDIVTNVYRLKVANVTWLRFCKFYNGFKLINSMFY